MNNKPDIKTIIRIESLIVNQKCMNRKKSFSDMDINALKKNNNYYTSIDASDEATQETRGRSRTKKVHSQHKRSLSYGATPRGAAFFSRQPLAPPQKRLSIAAKQLKLSGKFSSEQNWTLVCLAIVSFTSMLSMSIIAPFFPLEASLKGMRETVYGFVFSVYALVIMICSPVSGKLIPIIGPKFMLVCGIFITGFSNILFGVLDRINDLPTFTAFCFVVRIAEALGAASFTTASYTIIMQIFPDNIGTALGFVETSVGLGLSLGPAIGGALYSIGGYGLPFYVLGGLMLINIPICWVIIKPIKSLRGMKRNSKHSFLKLVTIPQVFVVGIVVVITSQTISFLDPTIEPHFREMNIGPEYVSIVFLLLSAAYTVSSPIVGWFSGHISNKFPVMAFGLFLSFAALLMLGPSFVVPLKPSIWLSVGSIAVIGIAYAIAFIPTFESILDLAIDKGFTDDISTYSLVSGLWSAMYSLGEVTGPSLGGWLSENFNFSYASTIMASFSLLGALIAGITCFFVTSQEYDVSSNSSSNSMTTDADNTSTTIKTSNRTNSESSSSTSESDTDQEIKYLLNNSSLITNSYVIGDRNKNELFSTITI